MAQRDFRDRLSRINPQEQASIEVKETTHSPSSVARVFWLVLGVVWGLAVFTAIPFLNENYDAAKLEIDAGTDMGKAMLLLFAFTFISLALFALLLLVGLIFVRKKKGFWMLILGFLFGSTLASISLKVISIPTSFIGTG